MSGRVCTAWFDIERAAAQTIVHPELLPAQDTVRARLRFYDLVATTALGDVGFREAVVAIVTSYPRTYGGNLRTHVDGLLVLRNVGSRPLRLAD